MAEDEADAAEALASAAEAALAEAAARRVAAEAARLVGEDPSIELARLEEKRLAAERRAREWESRAVEADAAALAAENERKRTAAATARGDAAPSEAEVQRLITKQLEAALSEAAVEVGKSHPLSPNFQVKGWAHSPRNGSLPKGHRSNSEGHQPYKRTTSDEVLRSNSGRTASSQSSGSRTYSGRSPTRAEASPPPPTPVTTRLEGVSEMGRARVRPERASRRARASPGARRPAAAAAPTDAPAQPALPAKKVDAAALPLPVKSPRPGSPKVRAEVPLHKQAVAEALPL